jgi:hypothetical protein
VINDRGRWDPVPVPSPLTGRSGWVGSGGVGVAEGAGPGVGAGVVGVCLECPASVFELMVMSAEWFESAGLGVVGDCPGVLMVEV